MLRDASADDREALLTAELFVSLPVSPRPSAHGPRRRPCRRDQRPSSPCSITSQVDATWLCPPRPPHPRTHTSTVAEHLLQPAGPPTEGSSPVNPNPWKVPSCRPHAHHVCERVLGEGMMARPGGADIRGSGRRGGPYRPTQSTPSRWEE